MTELITGFAEALQLSLAHTTHLLQGRIVVGTTGVGSIRLYTTSGNGVVQQTGVTGGRSFTGNVGVSNVMGVSTLRTIRVQVACVVSVISATDGTVEG